MEFEKFYNFYFDLFLIRALDQWENSVFSDVLEVFAISNKAPRTTSPLLPPLASPLLLCFSTAAPPPAIFGRPSPPPAMIHLHASISSHSAALAPLFWLPVRLPRPTSLVPEPPPSDSSPPPWQMPASPRFLHPALLAVSSSSSSSSHSSRFASAVYT
jgi:hypothetical protein